MDNFVDERDFKLLENDKYTFFVLKRIMGGECKLLLTDHSRLIICFSGEPFPVWIWTADDATPEEMEKAFSLCDEHGFLDGSHTFNVKYELSNYFIKKAAEKGENYAILTNMFAYDCPALSDNPAPTDGGIYQCQPDDIDEYVEFSDLFHKATGIDQQSRESYRKRGEQAIKDGRTYFWKNDEGKNVASCNYNTEGELACIGLVFTKPEYRRHHYAENLVYQVTKKGLNAGFMPMLYTDADYTASNACYEKIGYILRGKLCTVGKPNREI